MSKYERILVYGLLLICLCCAFRKPAPAPVVVSSPVSTVASNRVQAVKEVKPADDFRRNSAGEIVENLPLSWFRSGDDLSVWLDGVLLSEGSICSRGVVELVSVSAVKFRDIDGKARWVYHAPAIVHGSNVAVEVTQR